MSRGAVQAEVGRVVDVHEQLGHRLGQLEARRGLGRVLPLVPERRHDQRHVHGQRGEQEGEGHGEQHDGELGPFGGRDGRAPFGERGGERGNGVVVVVARGGRRGVVVVVVVVGG